MFLNDLLTDRRNSFELHELIFLEQVVIDALETLSKYLWKQEQP